MKLLFFLLVSITLSAQAVSDSSVVLTMLDVNGGQSQADAHLLEFSDGKNILIDAGDPLKNLAGLIKQKGIAQIHAIYVSHAHQDHYSGILELLENGIRIDEVRFVIPPKEICDKEIPWGCRLKEATSLVEILKSRRIKVGEYQPGEVLYQAPGISLKVLYAFDGVHTPVGKTDVNDMSAILRLEVGKTSVLFTGDLNRPIGEFLAKEGKEIESDILKVPHHGLESLAPNAFFDKVHPKAVLVPVPKELWESDRAKRPREYFLSKKIKTYVSGTEGSIQVKLNTKSFEITSLSRK